MQAKSEILDFLVHCADDTLILGHRNSEWCGHGPILEQDIAVTNISLDLIGQARNFYQYAAKLKADGSTEDTLAYLRDNRAYKNCLLVELPNGDWGETILRQFFFSAYQFLLYEQLTHNKDATVAAISSKALKEVTYHLRWSGEWVIRLGDGTSESHDRMKNAIDQLWPYTGELFMPAVYEKNLINANLLPDVSKIKTKWFEKVQEVFAEATLPMPSPDTWMHSGGKNGNHTEHLGYILAELQFLQRAYPNSNW